jgi:uncharacterized membrane protein
VEDLDVTTNTLTTVHHYSTTRLLTIAARVVTAAITAAMAVIHFHLWNSGDPAYKTIPTIGVLFLLNVIGGIILAIALLITPTKFLSVTLLLTGLFTLGTLIGLIVALHTTLFGFHEYYGVPYERESVQLESVGTGLALILSGVYARATLAWYRQAVRGRRATA